MEKTISRDVGLATFSASVLERSHTVPVVVDFWAPWCRPCLTLGPVLERLAEEANGAWELVKVNTDLEPEIAARYGIQGIPAVKGFRDGKLVNEFVGVVPEPAIRAFLERVMPSPVDRLVAEAQTKNAAGEKQEAESLFKEAIRQQKDHAGAALGLAELLLAQGNQTEARALLEEVPPGTEDGRQAAALLKRLKFIAEAASLPSREEADAVLAANPNDLTACWAAAMRAAADGDYAKALVGFLRIAEEDRRFQDDGGRKAMLDIFTILGPDHELSMEFRPRLAGALH
ncbi:MAG: tetratricopeptide repeat protein [Chloroflexota bacterium]